MRSMRNALFAVAAVAFALAAACPNRQSARAPESDAWREEVDLHTGQSASVDDGGLTITLESVDVGNRVGYAYLRLEPRGGESVQARIEAVYGARFSDEAKAGPYEVRLKGYPGADSATLVVDKP